MKPYALFSMIKHISQMDFVTFTGIFNQFNLLKG